MRKEVVLIAVALVVLTSLVSADKAPLISGLEEEILVCESSEFSYKFNVAELDGDTLSVGISPSGPFFIRPVAYDSPITEVEIFSENLTKLFSDKVYEHTIFVSDGTYIDSQDIEITVLESNNPPNLEFLPAQTVDLNVSNRFRKQVVVSDSESGTPTQGGFEFSVSDPLDLLGIQINDQGLINYTGYETHVGVHEIEVCVTDTGLENVEQKIGFCGVNRTEATACSTFQLSVTESNRPPTILLSNSSNSSSRVPGTEQLLMEVYTYDPDDVYPDVYWYVDEKLKQINTRSSSNRFFYTFGCEKWGRHKIEAVATDGLTNDSVKWILDVGRIPCPDGIVPREKIGSSVCEEKWGCLDWGLCQNALQSHESGTLRATEYQDLQQRCNVRGWNQSSCGYQIRSCVDVNNCNTIKEKPLEIIPCQFSFEPDCSDGIKNCHKGQCEFLADCGGPCSSCETCSDGIKNQGEKEIDCGGPCAEDCIEPSTTQEPSEDENFLKQTMLVVIVIAIAVAVIQVIRILKNRNVLEQPKREITKKNE